MRTLLLNDYNLTVRSGRDEVIIPYANITNVRLCKVSAEMFRMVVSYTSGKTLIVTNQFVSDAGEVKNQSRLYVTFVRVLHFHLKDKSTALYTSGCSREKLWRSAVIATFVSFVLCFVADFLGFNIINPYVDACLLSVFFAGLLLMMQVGRLPKDYSATHIPFELLPAA